MPALEIMPQIASIEDIPDATQRRRAQLHHNNAAPQHEEEHKSHNPSKLSKWMKSHVVVPLRKVGHKSKASSAHPKKDGNKGGSKGRDTQNVHREPEDETENMSTSFSSITVRYFPKIREHEDEEPPELLGNDWSE